VVAPPPGLAVPWSVAPPAVTPVAPTVTTTGTSAGVVRATSAPNAVPTPFEAMAQA
jgi:hypothetical protein